MALEFKYDGPLPAFAATSGPRNAKIALVAEAFGQQEELTKQPLIGSSGQELNRMLKEAGIDRSHCFATNVFAFRPTANNMDMLCLSKKEVGGKEYVHPAIKIGKYIEPRFFPEIERLRSELQVVQPNLIICLGAIATWAVLNTPKIGSIRGTISEASLTPGIKVLPTYHPSAVLRNWALRTIVVADLLKAEREAKFPEIKKPQRFFLVRPTLAEIADWFMEHTQDCPLLSVDIETSHGQITNIGFATHRQHSINIPFCDKITGISYWPDFESEKRAWRWVKHFCALPMPKLFQNGMYDLQYLWRMGIKVNNVREDTMLLHHALYPEMQKGLGFLGSIYTSESSWKLMASKKNSTKGVKADDE